MRKSQGFLAVCTVPDVCKTPMGSSTPAVPYQVVGKLQDSLSTAPTVRFNGGAAIGIHRTYIPTTLGDSAGSAKGIKSGTVGAEIRPTSSSSSVRVEGYPVVREHDTCSMNSGNTVGKYVCPPSPGSASARLANSPSPAPNTPGMLELAASYWQRYSSAVHQTGQTMVEVGDTVGLAGNGITVAGLGIGLVTGVTGAGAVAGGGIAAGGRVVAGAGYATSATGEGVQALASALDAAAEWVQTQEIKVSLNDVVVYMGGHLLDRATGKIPKVARTTKATQKAAGKTPAKAAEKQAPPYWQ